MSAFYDEGVLESRKYSILFAEDENCDTCNYISFSFYNVLIKPQCNKCDTFSALEIQTCTVCYRIQSFVLFENKCIIRKRGYNFETKG